MHIKHSDKRQYRVFRQTFSDTREKGTSVNRQIHARGNVSNGQIYGVNKSLSYPVSASRERTASSPRFSARAARRNFGAAYRMKLRNAFFFFFFFFSFHRAPRIAASRQRDFLERVNTFRIPWTLLLVPWRVYETRIDGTKWGHSETRGRHWTCEAT